MTGPLKPFFSFYGGKWRAAPHYPKPRHGIIVEPFAGSAGYSVRYHHLNIRLYDADPVVCGVWSYLIRSSRADILALPAEIEHVDALPDSVCQEARWLIGFGLNNASTHPGKQPSAWFKWYRRNRGPGQATCWGPARRLRTANQVDLIKHWQVQHVEGYSLVPNVSATWFIDPPYSDKAGRHYVRDVKDYRYLSEWCKGRSGQIIVCERVGATWLPFEPLRKMKAAGNAGRKHIRQAMWYRPDAQKRLDDPQ